MPDSAATHRPSGPRDKEHARRRIWLWAAGLALIAAGIYGGRSYSLSQRPNVLLITLDTTRADRIGCYGYGPSQTPTFDALAAEGVLFERAYTPAPLTLPAHASLLTGLYPPEHGLITNGRGRLADSVPTLTDTLRRAGYATAAFVGSFVLHSKFGMNRGFDVYDDDMTNTDPTEHGLHRQRNGRRVVDLALEWLAQPRRQPCFCWVHLYDAHHPYQAHADEFGVQFEDRPYDGELAYVDRQVRRLLDGLEKQGLRKRTLIIVVGDHGESLGEHNEEEHSLTLYDATLRVPWIWAGYGVTTAGRRVNQTVSLIDFSPTVLEAVGQRALPGVSGRSLRAALQGRDIAGKDCYGASDDPLFELGCAPVRSLATPEWKYIRSTEPELYDLKSDPHELHNLATEQPEQLAELEFRLSALERAMTLRKGADVQLTSQEQRALESLGYVGGTSAAETSAGDGSALPDIKRILPLSNAVKQARHLISAGQTAQAEQQLRTLIAGHPDYVDGRVALAELLTAQSQYSASRQVLEEIVARRPEEHAAHFQIGLVELAQNRSQEALGHFRTTLQLNPRSIGAMYNLALTLLQLGQPGESQQYFEEALELDPAYVNAHIGLGMALAAQQRFEQAMEHYRLALAYNAGAAEAHTNLAVLLMHQQRMDEGGEHLAKAAAAAPDNPETRLNYGTYLMSIGRLDQAIAELSEAVRLKPDHPQAPGRLQQAKVLKSQR